MKLLTEVLFYNNMKTILNIFYGILKEYCRLSNNLVQVAKGMKNFALYKWSQ